METFTVIIFLVVLGIAILAYIDTEFAKQLKSRPAGVLFWVFLLGVVTGSMFTKYFGV